MKPLAYLAVLAVPVSLTAGVIYSHGEHTLARKHCELLRSLVIMPGTASDTLNSKGAIWWVAINMAQHIRGNYPNPCPSFDISKASQRATSELG